MQPNDQHACFDHWLETHAAILYRTVNGFAEGEDRKDLMQEIMLALWKSIPSFRAQSKPSTFIYRVAHNAALTWKRSRQSYLRKMDRFEALPQEMHFWPDLPADDQLTALYAAIRSLPPLDRSLVLLLLDDISYAEMADIHGLTISNVGVRINRLKQKLAQSMKETSHGFR